MSNRKGKQDGKGRRPFRITPEDAKAEGARLRERLDAADREASPLFASQLADGELVSDEPACIASKKALPPEEAARLRAVGERLRERGRQADAMDGEAMLEAWDLGCSGTMSCAEWERLLAQYEGVEVTDELAAGWIAHAEACPACGKKYRELESKPLDPRIVRALSDKGCPEAGILPAGEIARLAWEKAHGEPPTPPAEAL